MEASCVVAQPIINSCVSSYNLTISKFRWKNFLAYPQIGFKNKQCIIVLKQRKYGPSIRGKVFFQRTPELENTYYILSCINLVWWRREIYSHGSLCWLISLGQGTVLGLCVPCLQHATDKERWNSHHALRPSFSGFTTPDFLELDSP